MFLVKNFVAYRCLPASYEIVNFLPDPETPDEVLHYYPVNGLHGIPLIPEQIVEQYKGTHKLVNCSFVNEAGIGSINCNIGKNGLFHLILPEGKIIDQLILSKSEIDLNIYFSEKSLLYSFYNPTEVETLFLDIKIADDERKVYHTIKSNPKDITFPSNEIDRIINSSNQKQIKEKNSSRNKSKENKHLKAKNWSQVTIELVSDDSVRVKVPGMNSKRFNYTDLGMRDSRKGDLPNQLWLMIKNLAENNGVLPTDEMTYHRRGKIEKTIQRLRSHLRSFFGIEGMPINRYSKKHGYVTQFKIKDCRPIDQIQSYLE